MRFAVRRNGLAVAVLGLWLARATSGCSTAPNVPRDASEQLDAVSPGSDAATGPDLSVGRLCADHDHDGYGTGCAAGPDCDDNNPGVTDACYRCIRPATGCACTTEGARAPCDFVTDSVLAGPDGTCHMGERSCSHGTWTRCAPSNNAQRFIGPIASCASMCDETCQNFVVCPIDPGDIPGHGTNVDLVTDRPLPVGICPDMMNGGVTLTGTISGSASCTGVPGICAVIPPGGTAGPLPISVTTAPRDVDVHFLVDTTSSMSGALANLRAAATGPTSGCGTDLLNCVRAAVPSVAFGVGSFDDFPVSPYGTAGCGTGGDFVYHHALDLTTALGSAQSALTSLAVHCGGDAPDSHVAALNAIATGTGYLNYLDDRATSTWGACPSGYTGYPCFRPGAVPIIVMYTDSVFHNGPGDVYLYDDSVLWPPISFVMFPTPTVVPTNDNDRLTSPRIPVIDGSMPYQATGSTVSAHNDWFPGCTFSFAADVVFRLHVPAAGTYQIDTRGSAYDTVLSLTTLGGTRLACNDNYYGTQSRIVYTFAAAGDYYIWVDGYASRSGTYVLRVTQLPAASTLPSSPRFDEAVAALNTLGAKVAVLQTCGDPATTPACQEVVDHATALANGTGSLLSGGVPAVYNIPSDGSGIATSIVQAVTALSSYTRLDISARALDNPATPVDERCFVVNPAGTGSGTLRLSDPALGEAAPYPPGNCTDPPASVGGVNVIANQCIPGTTVNFRLALANSGCVAATGSPQTFTFDVVTYGNGVYELSRQTVTVVIPPAPVYPSNGTYTFDVDGSTACTTGQVPDWTELFFGLDTPNGTTIGITAQTGATLSDASTGVMVNLGSAPANSSPVPISNALAAAGQVPNLPFLRITFTLSSDSTMLVTPWFGGAEVRFHCIDAH